MDEEIVTVMMIMNGVINVVILYLVAPLYQLRGAITQIKETIKHHEHRLLSLEERSNGNGNGN